MMFYKDTKTMIHSPDGNTDFFDIFTGVLQGDTLASFPFIIWLHTMSINTYNKRKWFHTKKMLEADIQTTCLMLDCQQQCI